MFDMLNPTQAHILTISEKHIDYANEVASKLKSAGELRWIPVTIRLQETRITERCAQRSFDSGDEEMNNGTISTWAQIVNKLMAFSVMILLMKFVY